MSQNNVVEIDSSFIDFVHSNERKIRQQVRSHLGSFVPEDEFDDLVQETTSELYIMFRKGAVKKVIYSPGGYLAKTLDNYLRSEKYRRTRTVCRENQSCDQPLVDNSDTTFGSTLESYLEYNPEAQLLAKEAEEFLLSGLNDLGRTIFACRNKPSEAFVSFIVQQCKDAKKSNVRITSKSIAGWLGEKEEAVGYQVRKMKQMLESYGLTCVSENKFTQRWCS